MATTETTATIEHGADWCPCGYARGLAYIEEVLTDRFRQFVNDRSDDPTKKRDYFVARAEYLAQPGRNYKTLHALLTAARGRAS